MRINKLELFGFKSFPDRTAFEFGSGISCVVGPNGSGKSNVVDALRWVIGEQSARSLRGKEMSDVIFAGSSVRSPVGFAEVTLTLGVGNGDPFPGDFARFEELEVGRRLYRDGTSEYLINRVKSRRRDIVDLFLDTGVGANLYSFIAQGQVDRIVSQSPKDRRSLIDEAAGISRYKIRREEALVRLAATGTQLDRASDVADEMGRRLRTLQRQVLRAGRFRRLRATIRQREIALGVVKYSALSGDRRAYRERLRKLKDTVGALERSIERVETDLHTREEEIEAVRGAVSTWRDQSAELEAVRREQEGAASLHRARHDELQAEAARAEARAQTAKERAESAKSTGARLLSEQGEAEAALEALPLDEVALEHGRLTTEVERCRIALDALTAAAAQVAAEKRALEEALERAREPEEEPLAELPDVEAQVEEVKAVEARQAAAELAEADLAEEVIRQREAVRKIRGEIDALNRAHRAADHAWEQARREGERRRKQALEEARKAVRRAEEEARRAVTAERQARLQRHQQWVSASRKHHHRLREENKAWAVRARADFERERRREQGELAGREKAEVEEARAAVDQGRVKAAELALHQAVLAEDAARTAATEAQTKHAALRSRLAALEAEWSVLEEQRSASVPDAWSERPLFEVAAEPDDPRRLARPEVLGLPILEVGDLNAEEGRGLWRTPNRWVMVEDLDAAIAHLQQVGPPVASRDGAIRVDADGVVELGWERGSRWAAVRSERIVAARAVEQGLAAVEASKAATAVAIQAVRTARQELEQARSTLQREQEAAVVTAREAVRKAGEALRERWQGRSREVEVELERRQAHLEEARAGAAELEAEARAAAQTLSTIELPVTSMARGALAAMWPVMTEDRPAPPVLPEVDEGELSKAETRLAEQRRQVSQIRREVEIARQTLRQVERRRDALVMEQTTREAAKERRGKERAALQERLEALEEVEGVDEAREAYARSREAAAAARQRMGATQDERGRLRESIASLRAKAEALQTQESRAEDDQRVAQEERSVALASAEEALKASLEAKGRAEVQAVQRAEVMAKLSDERDRLSRLLEEATKIRKGLEKNRAELQSSDAERIQVAAKVSQIQLDIEGIRKRLGERYQVSLPGLLDRLSMRRELVLTPDPAVQEPLQIGETLLEAVETLIVTPSLLDDESRIVEMVNELEELRKGIQKLGEVNLASETEYRELAERFGELDRQRADLEASVKSIRAAIAKMNRTCRERFRDAYDRVNEAFQLAYPQLVGGGDARLALTDEEDLLETGVDIFVRPPGKRLQNLTLLSGGEKAMTAIALLLAIFKVRPSPFCVLDEVDAPLDEANGSRFNAMIREMSNMSQFIVITHNRTTMECADVLYGVTMAAPGVSSLVSVALERGRT